MAYYKLLRASSNTEQPRSIHCVMSMSKLQRLGKILDDAVASQESVIDHRKLTQQLQSVMDEEVMILTPRNERFGKTESVAMFIALCRLYGIPSQVYSTGLESSTKLEQRVQYYMNLFNKQNVTK